MNSLWKIGDIIREIRLINGKCTQETFAEMIDASVETVSNIERGLVLLNTKTLVAICKKCHISADYILGNENCNTVFTAVSPEVSKKWDERLEKEGISREDFLARAIMAYIEE